MGKSNILILGGCGFIGSHLVDIFIKNEYNVYILSQSLCNSTLSKEVKYYSFDYTEGNFIKFLSENNFSQIHYLSGNPSPVNSFNNPYYDLEKTNYTFLALLEACQKTCYKGSLWFASSVAVYGENDSLLLSETTECKPLSSYGVSKLMCEEFLKMYNRVYGLNCGAYRIFSTYGPKLKRQLVYDLMVKMSNNALDIEILGSGSEARDMTFVYDQANAIFIISEKVIPNGDIFNVGSGKLYSVNDILNTLLEINNIKPKIHYTNKTRSYDGKSWVADISKIKSLGWEEQYSLREGLSLTWRFFRNEN